MQTHLGRILGRDSIGTAAMTLVQSSLSQSSYATYSTGLKRFLEFCSREGTDPLTAGTGTVVRYIAYLGQQGTVAAGSLQPYLSAINRWRQDLGAPAVAMGPLVTAARKGLARLQQDTEPQPVRVALPASVACRLLLLAEFRLSALQAAPSTERLGSLREVLAALTSYLFFGRGAAQARLLSADLAVDDVNITFLHRSTKGRQGRPQQALPLVSVPSDQHPRMAALLRSYISFHSVLVRSPFLWAVLPSMERPGSWTADIMTSWLHASCVAVGALPPPGFSWTSHSLRKGAASAAVACGVPLQTVKWYGDWARDSDVVHDYVDASFLPDDPARYWFGWRSPVGPAAFPAWLHLGDASLGAPPGLSSPANCAN